MKNKILKGIMVLGASIFTVFAFSISVSACGWSFYQTKEPKCLRDE